MSNRHFLEWIKRNHCCVCGTFDYVDPKSGDPIVTPSHVKTRGSGGCDFENVVPMCFRCHRKYEDSTSAERKEYKQQAIQWTRRYFESLRAYGED